MSPLKKIKVTAIEINKKRRAKAAVVFPEVAGRNLELSPVARLEEAVGLAMAIDLDVVHQEIVKLRTVRPASFLGQGIIDKLAAVAAEREIDLLIVDSALTSVQQRTLENKLGLKVIDRTALILEIFGERAQTREGKLQVELAHLTYQRSRLVRSWTHLERQRGGAGFLGGPGETQIELDRRIIDDKIVKIKKELEKVRKTRSLQRHARERIPYPVVALVGYTNAGKSTWFNLLTQAGVLAEDMLFATLDPSMRKIRLPSGREVILSDTVGFISDLPHELVMAFRATLEEVLAANVIVHVRDISNPDNKSQRRDVINVLNSLGLERLEDRDDYLELINKIDLLPPDQRRHWEEQAARFPRLLPVSAVSGEGRAEFLQKLDDCLAASFLLEKVKIPASDGRLAAWIHANAEVLQQKLQGETLFLSLKISPENFSRLKKHLADL